jgi:hypothetical protein
VRHDYISEICARKKQHRDCPREQKVPADEQLVASESKSFEWQIYEQRQWEELVVEELLHKDPGLERKM